MVALPKTTPPPTTYRQTEWVSPRRQQLEWLKCSLSPLYFACHYVHIYDALAGDWIPFRLWPAQARALRDIRAHRQVVILKARQLGVTWLALTFALWLMLFHPAATILLFSRRDDEAIELLDERLKGMYRRLPAWLQARAVATNSKHEFALSNGSRALSFPSNGGDSYTATLVIADEFDLVTDQARLLGGMKPTIDNGGRLILLSRPDKSRPQTPFKAIYRAAKNGANAYFPIFLPWDAHPRRDAAWYAAQKQDAMSQAGALSEDAPGALDDLHEQYPATDAEALSARSGDKRLAGRWLNQCYEEAAPLSLPDDAPSIPTLRLYAVPEYGAHYVIGADPAEGNPTSDDSALTVRCRETGAEVASLAGKFQPTTFAAHLDRIGRYFNRADLMIERNNHGHAVLAWLRDNSPLRCLPGHDRKPGWHSTTKGKALLYDACADAYRHGEVTLHTFKTFTQLSSIEGSTLRAPEGEHDDLADSDALSICALAVSPVVRQARSYQG